MRSSGSRFDERRRCVSVTRRTHIWPPALCPWTSSLCKGANISRMGRPELDLFHVRSPHALTQSIGYLKFVAGQRNASVFFRGQCSLHKTLSPTLFRGVSSQHARTSRISKLRGSITFIRNRVSLFEQMPFEAREPLLQHYGLRTSWIDLVDNVWIALWFACYKALTIKRMPQYLHFESNGPLIVTPIPIPMFWSSALTIRRLLPAPPEPGLFRGPNTELIDLRVACPSVFLRPHAQHGVLFRMRGAGPGPTRPVDYSPQICGRIRIDLRDALAWLGTGKMLGTHALFPPPFYDQGYALLLNCGFDGSPTMGAIQHVGT